MKSNQVIESLSALAQDTRLAAFRLLVRAGERGLAAGEIARRLGMPASTLSFHLRTLAQAGLIRQRRESRSLIYSVDFPRVSGVVNFLTENCCADEGGCAPLPSATKRKSRG